MENNNNGPVARFKAGSITAAVWDNNVKVKDSIRSIKKVTVERRYTDKDGNWKSSTSFARDEIALVKYCLDQAFAFMLETPESSSEGDS